MTELIAEIPAWFPKASEFLTFSPELAWVGTLCLIMLAPLAIGRDARVTAGLAIVGIAVTAFFTFKVMGIVSTEGPQTGLTPNLAGGMLIADNLSLFFKLLLLAFLVGVSILWMSVSAKQEDDAPEFFVLLVGSALGMSLMVSTQNILMMIIAIEFASLPSYAIVGFNKEKRIAAEASLKYMIFGSVSAAVMLYGVSLIYGFFGTLDIAQIAANAGPVLEAGGANRLLVGLGMFCVFVGIAFKISAVPFHFWCPDAFEGAKTEVTAWLSVASKAAGLLLLMRLAHVFCQNAGAEVLRGFAIVIAVVATITCTVGNLSAYKQTSVKRMLAYSSIAHAGYMMAAAAILVDAGQVESFTAISAVLAYVVVYMLMNLGAFGVVALLESKNGGDDSITAFAGLGWKTPILAIPMLFCLVSLVGIPPFAGFITKWYLLAALGETGIGLYWALAIVIVINTLISLWYYMRVVVQMFLKDTDEPGHEVPMSGALLVNVCGALLIVLLVFSNPLKNKSDQYSVGLFSASSAALTDLGKDDSLAQSNSQANEGDIMEGNHGG
ncbi:MAG: NADH-quinone oxidoreductase subunit N [Phycisphaerae bacterium]|nr:MAG: NADH-quinone oxidoreductase subunit N [Phycisphaerae bacterium]